MVVILNVWAICSNKEYDTMVRINKNVFPGAKFNKLTVIKRLPKDEKGRHKILCRCDCGTVKSLDISAVVGGGIKSCGCGRFPPVGEGYGKVFPGAEFGRLTVIKRVLKNGKRTSKVKCLCSCGNKTLADIDSLVNEKTQSCGCLAKELTAERNRKSAKFGRVTSTNPGVAVCWTCMMGRCYRKKNKSYHKYGGAGVVVCEFLRQSPQNLLSLLGDRPDDQNTLDRYPIYNGNYTCGQCDECKRNGWKLNIRWASRYEQSNNTGRNVHLTAFGQTMTMSQWGVQSGIAGECIRKRLLRGWSSEKCVSTPDKYGNCYKPPSV